MDNEIYEEDVVHSCVSNNEHSIQYLLGQMRDVYSTDAGWTMSEPQITPNNDGKTVTVRVHVTKVLNQGLHR